MGGWIGWMGWMGWMGLGSGDGEGGKEDDSMEVEVASRKLCLLSF